MGLGRGGGKASNGPGRPLLAIFRTASQCWSSHSNFWVQPRTAVPNLFGTGDRFFERKFFHGLGWEAGETGSRAQAQERGRRQDWELRR